MLKSVTFVTFFIFVFSSVISDKLADNKRGNLD